MSCISIITVYLTFGIFCSRVGSPTLQSEVAPGLYLLSSRHPLWSFPVVIQASEMATATSVTFRVVSRTSNMCCPA